MWDDSIVQDVDEHSLPKLPNIVTTETLQPAVQDEDISEHPPGIVASS